MSIKKAMEALDSAIEQDLNEKRMNLSTIVDCDVDLEDPDSWPEVPRFDASPKSNNQQPDNVISKRPVILYQDTISEKDLMLRFPVSFSLSNKQLVADNAYPAGKTEFLPNNIHVSRWRSNPQSIPDTSLFPNNPSLNVVNSFFEYTSITGGSSWYPNFAHQCLFTAWDSYLLAQDELQVLEFPCLAALHSFLPRQGSLTVDSEGPSPILIQGAIRRCSLDTLTSPSIYGNAFRRASEQTVLDRLSVLDPPISSNIYAMEAPTRGWGEYKIGQINSILSTAYTAFSQIVALENEKEAIEIKPVELHIGYWGCGAYGGNAVLMILVQLLAAKLAGIEYVIVHGSPDVSHAQRAVDLFEHEMPLSSTPSAVAWIALRRFKWGVSDGN